MRLHSGSFSLVGLAQDRIKGWRRDTDLPFFHLAYCAYGDAKQKARTFNGPGFTIWLRGHALYLRNKKS